MIIAEAGLNHNGEFELARELVREAAAAGCDGVKFQNFRTEDFIVGRALTLTYRSQGKEITEPLFDLCKRNEFQRDWIAPLKQECDALGIAFLSTPTSIEGIEDLRVAGCRYVKNGSDYLTHIPLIRAMAESGMIVVLSTGMADQADIDAAMTALEPALPDRVIVLHCTSSYPTGPDDVNLRRMTTLGRHYRIPVGFSDHTEGWEAAAQAASLGAVMIEKHFTLSHDLPGPDHWFSVTPHEMADLVRNVRLAENRLGRPELAPAMSERATRDEIRVGVVAARDLPAGHALAISDVAFRKPGHGILPNDIDVFLGRALATSVAAEQPLKPEHFEA